MKVFLTLIFFSSLSFGQKNIKYKSCEDRALLVAGELTTQLLGIYPDKIQTKVVYEKTLATDTSNLSVNSTPISMVIEVSIKHTDYVIRHYLVESTLLSKKLTNVSISCDEDEITELDKKDVINKYKIKIP